MALTSLLGQIYIPQPYFAGASGIPVTSSIRTLNDALDKVGMVFQVPKTGTLDWFEILQTTNSNTPDNGIRFCFEDVNASGNPDDTEDQFAVCTSGFATDGWLVPANVMTNDGTSGGTKRSVTRGQLLAITWRFENFVAGDSVDLGGCNTTDTCSFNNIYSCFSGDGGTNYSKAAGTNANFALKYSDGTYAVLNPTICSYINSAQTSFNNASSPASRGNLFQLPVPMTVGGIWVRWDNDNAADLIIYNGADSILASYSAITANRISNAGLISTYQFDTPIDLAAATNYRMIVKPTTASNVTVYRLTYNSAAINAAQPLSVCQLTTGATGSWTETTTARQIMGLVVDKVHDGSGGGGTGGGSYAFVG